MKATTIDLRKSEFVLIKENSVKFRNLKNYEPLHIMELGDIVCETTRNTGNMPHHFFILE